MLRQCPAYTVSGATPHWRYRFKYSMLRGPPSQTSPGGTPRGPGPCRTWLVILAVGTAITAVVSAVHVKCITNHNRRVPEAAAGGGRLAAGGVVAEGQGLWGGGFQARLVRRRRHARGCMVMGVVGTSPNLN